MDKGIVSSFILNIKLSSIAVPFCAMYTLPFNVISENTVVSVTSSKSTFTTGYATVMVFCPTLTSAFANVALAITGILPVLDTV